MDALDKRHHVCLIGVVRVIEPLALEIMSLAQEKGIGNEMIAATDEQPEAGCLTLAISGDDHDLDIRIVETLHVHLEANHAHVQLTAERALLATGRHYNDPRLQRRLSVIGHMADRLREEGRLGHDGAVREEVAEDDAHFSSAKESKQTGVAEGATRGWDGGQLSDVVGQGRTAGQALLQLAREGSAIDAGNELSLRVEVSSVLKLGQESCLVVRHGTLFAQNGLAMTVQRSVRRHESSAQIVQHIGLTREGASAQISCAATLLLAEQSQAVAMVSMATVHDQLTMLTVNKACLVAERARELWRTFNLSRVHGGRWQQWLQKADRSDGTHDTQGDGRSTDGRQQQSDGSSSKAVAAQAE